MWLDKKAIQVVMSLEGSQCVRAAGERVPVQAKIKSPSPLTPPTSLEMLKYLYYAHNPVLGVIAL
jgi:hypothetical protein